MSEYIGSAHGQNVLCIEVFPRNISSLCEGFANKYSKQGLAHPHLHGFRKAVIIFSLASKSFYVANGLDVCIHAGLVKEMAVKCFQTLVELGYKVVDPNVIDLSANQVCLIL